MDIRYTKLVAAIGRTTIASLFLFAGVLKIATYGDVIERMHDAGLKPAAVLLPLTIALELGGGLIVAIGRWGASVAALMLAVFTLTTNFYFHNFWEMEGELAALEGSLFLKNLAIMGGLIFIAAATAQQSSASKNF